MSASDAIPTPEGPPVADDFGELEGLVNQHLGSAAVANTLYGELYRYYVLKQEFGLRWPLAEFCIANTVEPLGEVVIPEYLRLAVPIRAFDAHMPISVLGTEEHFFRLTYRDSRRRRQVLHVTPELYREEFTGGKRPPVKDFTHKLLTYFVVPLRARDEEA